MRSRGGGGGGGGGTVSGEPDADYDTYKHHL
jgi:hypothetical protein